MTVRPDCSDCLLIHITKYTHRLKTLTPFLKNNRAVAVVALLKEVGASKRLGHIIEGESLVNDGTAIVVFSLLNEIAKGATKTASEVVLFFLWVPTGSVLVGVGVAIGCHTWLGLGAVAGDHVVQISVTLFACYLCFLVAEFEAESSGVLAVVVLGVAIGAFGRGFFTVRISHPPHSTD